jgi:hypothetical protein
MRSSLRCWFGAVRLLTAQLSHAPPGGACPSNGIFVKRSSGELLQRGGRRHAKLWKRQNDDFGQVADAAMGSMMHK